MMGYLFRQQPLYTGVSEDLRFRGGRVEPFLHQRVFILRAYRLSLDSI